MNRVYSNLLRLGPLVGVLSFTLSAAAAGDESISANWQYHPVDFAAATNGVPTYSTWLTPNGANAKYFDLNVSTGFIGGPNTSQIGMCYVLTATSNHDEKFWMKDQSGNWISVADDINGLDPKMVLWMRTGPSVTIRVSDYNTIVGKFTMATQIWYTTGNLTNDEFECDSDIAPGFPYVKVAQDGTVTFVRRQGFP